MIRRLARHVYCSLPERFFLTKWLRTVMFRGWMATRDTQQVFTGIHRHRAWNDPESVSGPGSSLAATADLRDALPALLAQHRVRSLLDVPCGDFNWLRHVDLTDIDYVGGDIVPEIVERNRRNHTAPGRQFRQLNLIADPLPAADLLMTRDCLVHLSYRDVSAALRNIARSDIRYVLLTTYPTLAANEDTYTGGWRPLNFVLPPFQLPAPEFLLTENAPVASDGFEHKALGLWSVPVLRRHFELRPSAT